MTKICGKCKTEKELSLFSLDRARKGGFNRVCKQCDSVRDRLRTRQGRKRNLSTVKRKCLNCHKLKFEHLFKKDSFECKSCSYKREEKVIRSCKICSFCQIEKPVNLFYTDRRSKDGLSCKCKPCVRLYQQNPIVKARTRKVEKIRLETNLQAKLKAKFRERIRAELKGDKIKKDCKTEELLGIEISKFIQHFELKFLPGMNWTNRGRYSWHIDHIVPCDFFNLEKEEELRKCFHYTNLMPRWATTEIAESYNSHQIGNIDKGNRLVDNSYFHLLENPS